MSFARVELRGWRVGLRKVSLNALLRDEAKLGAREAHTIVSRLMDNESVHVTFDEPELARDFVRKARELGAIVGDVELCE